MGHYGLRPQEIDEMAFCDIFAMYDAAILHELRQAAYFSSVQPREHPKSAAQLIPMAFPEVASAAPHNAKRVAERMDRAYARVARNLGITLEEARRVAPWGGKA